MVGRFRYESSNSCVSSRAQGADRSSHDIFGPEFARSPFGDFLFTGNPDRYEPRRVAHPYDLAVGLLNRADFPARPGPSRSANLPGVREPVTASSQHARSPPIVAAERMALDRLPTGGSPPFHSPARSIPVAEGIWESMSDGEAQY